MTARIPRRRGRGKRTVPCLLAALLCLFSAAGHADDGGFVSAHGTSLWLDGGPLSFVGSTLAVMHGAERTRYVETIVRAREDGIMVGRVWALGEGSGQESRDRQGTLFRVGPDGWNEEAFDHLDRVLAAARMVRMKLILVLANSWGDYGGIPMYMRWAGNADPGSIAATDAFYVDPRARELYREHLRRVVGRVSSVTGRAYADDPTILGWELVNESHVSPEGEAGRRAWIAEMAALVHELDRHHLVTFGALGYRTARERTAWATDHAVAGIDYCDHHFYAQPDVRIRSAEDVAAQVEDRVRVAHSVVGKPLVIGEIGVRAVEASFIGETRGSFFSRFLEIARASGASGTLAWIYLPPGIPRRAHAITWARSDGDDPDAASSLDVRRALRAAARRAWMGPDAPTTAGVPVFTTRFQVASVGDVVLSSLRSADRRRLTVLLPARRPTGARWERLGTTFEVTPPHAWGGDVGHFEWAFALPRGRPPTRVTVRATLSSERPGASAPEGVTSPVVVSLDGVRLGEVTAARDDGRGRPVEVTSADPAALARLGGGIARIRFEVPDVPAANGLCVYDPGVEVRLTY